MYPASFAKPWPWFSQESPSRKVAMGHSGAISLNFPSCKLRSNSLAINFKAARRTCVLVTSPPYPQRSSLSAVSVWLFNFPVTSDVWEVFQLPLSQVLFEDGGSRGHSISDWTNGSKTSENARVKAAATVSHGLQGPREALVFHLNTFALGGAQVGSLTQGTHTAPENEDVAADTPVSEAWGLPR